MERIEGKTNFMTMMQTQPITGPAVWQANDFVNDESWVHHLNSAEIDGLEAMLAQLAADGRSFRILPERIFQSARLRRFLMRWPKSLSMGVVSSWCAACPSAAIARQRSIHSFMRWASIWVNRSARTRGVICWGRSCMWAMQQRKKRVFMKPTSICPITPTHRMLSGLCVRKAKSGGMSSLVSAAAIYNEIIKRRPELLALYYRPFCYAHLGAGQAHPHFQL